MAAPAQLRADGFPRNTPRSLCRTLHQLRVVGREQTQKEVADALGWNEEQLMDMETCKKDNLTLHIHHVQRYQDLYGIPSSIINGVSQVFASARDKSDTQLKVLGLMFGKLSQRLADQKSREDLILRVHNGNPESQPNDLELVDWNNVLALLIMEVWGAAPINDLEHFKNDKRLKARRLARDGNSLAVDDDWTREQDLPVATEPELPATPAPRKKAKR